MGKQKTSESTSYNGSGQKWALPYAKEGVGQSFSVYNGAKGNLAHATAQTGTISDQLFGKFGAGQEQAGQARGYYGDVLGGKYLNNNQYLQGQIDSTNSDIRNQVGGMFEGAGRYGSGAHQDLLARNIGQNENAYRGADYANQMARMDSAAQGATTANAQDASQALGGYGVNAEMPYTGTNNLSNQLAALFNGGTQKSVQYGPNPLWGALGAGLGAVGTAAAGGAFSDERLKKDIVALGIRPDGLTAFEWTYKHDPEQARYRGVMADEVKIMRPDAYIPEYNGTGYAGVNYGALGTPMLKVAA